MVTSKRIFSRYIPCTPRSIIDGCVADRSGVHTELLLARCRAGRSRLACCRATLHALLAAPPCAPFSNCRHGRVAGASSSSSLSSGFSLFSPQACPPAAAASESSSSGAAAPPCNIRERWAKICPGSKRCTRCSSASTLLVATSLYYERVLGQLASPGNVLLNGRRVCVCSRTLKRKNGSLRHRAGHRHPSHSRRLHTAAGPRSAIQPCQLVAHDAPEQAFWTPVS